MAITFRSRAFSFFLSSGAERYLYFSPCLNTNQYQRLITIGIIVAIIITYPKGIGASFLLMPRNLRYSTSQNLTQLAILPITQLSFYSIPSKASSQQTIRAKPMQSQRIPPRFLFPPFLNINQYQRLTTIGIIVIIIISITNGHVSLVCSSCIRQNTIASVADITMETIITNLIKRLSIIFLSPFSRFRISRRIPSHDECYT